MIIRKLDFKTQDYEPVEIPGSWNCELYYGGGDDMSRLVNCPNCGTELRYGITYESEQYRNAFGFGYVVCGNCRQRERETKTLAAINESFDILEGSIRKWNFETHTYEPFEIPESWNCELYAGDDMDLLVNCPNCGIELPYGETYTSKQYHNSYGMGYGVCKDCYEKEWDAKVRAEQINES